MNLAPCTPDELPLIHAIINESAMAYQGVIPADRWHEPYMTLEELRAEIARGVRFQGCRTAEGLIGVMGIQDVRDVTLIRHAYVRTKSRGQGVGRALLAVLREQTSRPVLIGTWKAATWAIRFYEQSGFTLLDEQEKNRVLTTYWTIPARQVEESVVLADPKWRAKTATAGAKDGMD